jgi:hypothetical protein
MAHRVARHRGSHFSYVIGSQMAMRSSALRAGLPLPPMEDSWYSFLLEAEWTQGHSAVGRIRSIEKSNDFIGNRTCGLPACSIVPQPTRNL